ALVDVGQLRVGGRLPGAVRTVRGRLHRPHAPAPPPEERRGIRANREGQCHRAGHGVGGLSAASGRRVQGAGRSTPPPLAGGTEAAVARPARRRPRPARYVTSPSPAATPTSRPSRPPLSAIRHAQTASVADQNDTPPGARNAGRGTCGQP